MIDLFAPPESNNGISQSSSVGAQTKSGLDSLAEKAIEDTIYQIRNNPEELGRLLASLDTTIGIVSSTSNRQQGASPLLESIKEIRIEDQRREDNPAYRESPEIRADLAIQRLESLLSNGLQTNLEEKSFRMDRQEFLDQFLGERPNNPFRFLRSSEEQQSLGLTENFLSNLVERINNLEEHKKEFDNFGLESRVIAAIGMQIQTSIQEAMKALEEQAKQREKVIENIRSVVSTVSDPAIQTALANASLNSIAEEIRSSYNPQPGESVPAEYVLQILRSKGLEGFVKDLNEKAT